MYPTTSGAAPVLVAFLVFVGVTLLLCVLVGPEGDRVADFYTANSTLTPLQNGLALSGDYLSLATLLGTTGLVATAGYDGFALALSTALALGVLLVLARPLREAGRYTLGDVLAAKSGGAAPRIAAAVATLAVSVPFLMVQLSGAGSATALVLGLTNGGAQRFCTVLVGVLMVCYALLGGMKGTSLVQIAKVLLIVGTALAVVLAVLARFHWSLEALFAAAGRGSGHPAAYPHQGLEFGRGATGRLDFLSLQLTVVLGAACMPHMVMRLNASPSGAAARRSTRYAAAVVAVCCLAVAVLGLGAAALVGDRAITALSPNGQSALLLLAGALHGGGAGQAPGGPLFTAAACAVFVTALAVVAGITLAAAAALAHDVAACAARPGRLTQAGEVRAVRWSVVAVGAVGILLAVLTQGYNLQFLSSLAVTVAASAVLPALVYSLFWKRFDRTGLLWTVYGGLALSIGLQLFSPTVSGAPDALFPGVDFHWFPLQLPGLFSIPGAFLLGWAATGRGRPAPTAPARHSGRAQWSTAGRGQ